MIFKINNNFFKKRFTPLFMAFLMIWLISPLEVFASTEPDVTDLHLKTIRKDDGDYAGLKIEGSNLEGVRLFFNNMALDKTTIPDLKIIESNPFKYEVEYKIANNNKFPINTGINNIKTYRLVSGVPESKSFDFNLNLNATDTPTLDASDSQIFLEQPFTVKGTSLGLDADKTRMRLLLADRENTISTISPDAKSATVDLLKGPAGNSVDLGYKIYGVDAITSLINIHTSYTFVLYQAVVPVNKISGLDSLSVIPNKGPIAGGTILTINAKNSLDVVIEDNGLFNDKMEVWLRKTTEPNKGKEVKATSVELIKKNNLNIGLYATTPKIPIDQTGLYDLIVKQGSGVTSAEALVTDAFLYVEEGNPLTIAFVDPAKAKDTVPTQIQVVGKNIFNPSGISYSGQGANITVNPIFQVVQDGPITYLEVSYDLIGNPKYGSEVISSIKRRISLRVGDVAIPVDKDISDNPLQIESSPSKENHYTTTNVDAILFTTPSLSDVNLAKYPVVLETTTFITLVGGRILPEIKEKAELKDYFEYEKTEVLPVVSKIRPLHGYYNDVDSSNIKPIWLRLEGSNFQVIKTDDIDNPVKFPEVTMFRNDGTTLAPFDNMKVEVVKILKGNEIVDGEFNKFGDTMIVKIYPKNPDTFNLSDFILSGAGTQKDGYKEVASRFAIAQIAGSNQGSLLASPFFLWRYPSGGIENQLQPKIVEVLSDGDTVNLLSSDKTHNLEIRFTANTLNNPETVKVTIDGIDISDTIKKNEIISDDNGTVLKVTTPKGIIGDTSLQVIINEGLMDSYDEISFSPVTGPILKELVPNKGQAGTWIVIKRSTANNIGFIKPNPNEPETGSRVIIGQTIINDMNVYEVKDRDTIIFKTPGGLPKGKNKIQIQNPDKSRSQSINFEVTNPTTPTKIASIDPKEGDRKGRIPATITAGPGTSFAGEVDIYFGSQKATILGYNIDYSEVYVVVPEFKEKTLVVGETYTVPLTVVNKERFSTDTIVDGFTYIYPDYVIEITNIFKEGVPSNDPNRNKGLAGDFLIIEGKEIRAIRKDGAIIEKPKIYFGNKRVADADIISWDITPGTLPENPAQHPDGQLINLERIKIRVPAKPQNVATDGSVTVMLINPGGATAIKDKGFIYTSGSPAIIKESSTLVASRFFDTINVFAKDIYKDNLVVAFGDKTQT